MLLHSNSPCTARLSGSYSVTVIRDHFATARLFEDTLELSTHCESMLLEQVTRRTGELVRADDELESRRRIEETLSNSDAISELRVILNGVFSDPDPDTSPCTAHDELDPQALAKTAVEILRGETCVIHSSTNRGCRGKDVVNIELCRVGERGNSPRTSIDRGEIPGSHILREHTSNPASRSTRPKNYITETIALKIDDRHWDQSENYAVSPDPNTSVLHAALIRGLMEEVMRPLANHLQISSLQSEEAREEAGLIASRWLSQGARFEHGFANTEVSRSVRLNSEYLMHYVRIILPSDPQGVEGEGALQLLHYLHSIDEFPRDDDDGSLAWMSRTPNTSGLTVGLWWRQGTDERRQIINMQQHREGHLRLTPFPNHPQIRRNQESLTDTQFRSIYTDRMTDGLAANNRAEFNPAQFEQAIHHTSWENEVQADIENILNNSGQRQVTNRTKGPIRTAEITHAIPCDQCESEIGTYCSSNDPEELFSPDEQDTVYNIHERRVRCFLVWPLDGGDYRRFSRQFFLGGSNSPQHPPLSPSGEPDLVIHPTELVQGANLCSLNVVREYEDEPLAPEHVHLSEGREPELWEWNPQPDGPEDCSTDQGWWPPVHVNQTRRQLEDVAEALESTDFQRAVLRCEQTDGPAMALGLITPENLRLLAQHAIAYNQE